MMSSSSKNGPKKTEPVTNGSHPEDLIQFDNPIFNKHTAALRSDYGDRHDAMSDSMCIELDQSDSSEDDSAQTGPQVVKQQWRPHTIQSVQPNGGKNKPTNTSISLDPSALSNGIYQGLAITDADKLNQGMIPESVFMTARLEEQEHLEMSKFRFSSHVPFSSPFQPSLPTPKEESQEQLNDTSADGVPATPSPTVKLYTPPVPPVLPDTASNEEQKRRHILENLVVTEASLLNSLNIAVHNYMIPLKKACDSQEPILDLHEVNVLFGPIESIISCHELFYLALSSKTTEWAEGHTIGDCILSSFSGNVAVKTYSEYVNNFTGAMSILESRIKKKPRFVSFLKDVLITCATNLSLQGLLLKPIQRFPQYILMLQDFLKYTPSSHPDQMPLHMALTKLEGIAEHLNEAKRQREQTTIVHYLNSRISGLPFKLIDSQRRLLRQDIVTRLMLKDSKVLRKKRTLLLFSNMVLCASVRYKKRNPTSSFQEFPEAEGAKFQCKWYCTLDRLSVLEPDFSALNSTNAFSASEDPEVQASFQKLKTEHDELESDFVLMSKMEVMTKSLKKSYEGLNTEMLDGYCKQLLKMIAKNETLIKQCEGGRLDISIPNREGGQVVKHVYAFKSQRVKDNWLRTLRFARTKLASPNGLTWYLSSDQYEEEESVVVHDRRLPLYLNSHRIVEVEETISMDCATYIGDNILWLATSNSKLAQIVAMELTVLTGINNISSVHVFTVPDVSRIFSMANVTIIGTASSAGKKNKTVWVGSEDKRLIVYRTDGGKNNEVIINVHLSDSILSIIQISDCVCVGTADGKLVCFELDEAGSGWDFENFKTYEIHPVSLSCMCEVEGKLWIGAENYCFIFNLSTRTTEEKLTVTVPGKEGHVRRIIHVGAGVWVSLRQEMKLILFHTTTYKLLQEVNVKSNFKNILKSARITKLNGDHCHISNILATKGLLWLGTSLGITLIYRIPCLEGVPLISGRPYLAYDAHQDSVRVLLPLTVTARSTRQRIGSRVLREHVRKMNRPISSLGIIDDLHSSRDISPISDLSTSGNVTGSHSQNSINKTDDKDNMFSGNLSKESRDEIAREVIEGLTLSSKDDINNSKAEVKSSHIKRKHDYETLSWIGPDPKNEVIELTASQEGTSNYSIPPDAKAERKDSGDYETVEYPEDGHVVDVHNDLYTPMHPRHYSMSIPGKDDTITPPTEDTQLVVTAGRGLTHFRKLRSRTLYHQNKSKPVPVHAPSTVNKIHHDGYLIVYELDSTLRMFNPEGDGEN